MVIEKPGIGRFDSWPQFDLRRPARIAQAVRRHQLARRPIRLCFIANDLAVETDDFANQFGQFENCHIGA